MESMNDWHILKAAIEESRDEGVKINVDAGGVPEEFIFNMTDVSIIQALLIPGRRNLRDLREDIQKSRVSVYLSLRKLKHFSLVEEKKNSIELKKNEFTEFFYHLQHEGFNFEALIGERFFILQSLLDWKSIEQIAAHRNISIPSVYKYLKELSPLVEQDNRCFRVKEDRSNLIGFLKAAREQKEQVSDIVQIWSSHEGGLFKSRNCVNGSLTAFSRFVDFNVNYSPDYSYYHVPGKELTVEEIFIHSLRCSENEDLFSLVCEFYMKNNAQMDMFCIDELALRFDVVDSWMDLQTQVIGLMDDGIGVGVEEVTYSSHDDMFFSKSLSNKCGDIFGCEHLLLNEKLCWDRLFTKYVRLQTDPYFNWQGLLSRFHMLEKRTGVKIPIRGKLSKIYFERTLSEALNIPKTVSELMDEFNVFEYHLRNTLTTMVKAGVIRKMGTKPLTFVSSSSYHGSVGDNKE